MVIVGVTLKDSGSSHKASIKYHRESVGRTSGEGRERVGRTFDVFDHICR